MTDSLKCQWRRLFAARYADHHIDAPAPPLIPAAARKSQERLLQPDPRSISDQEERHGAQPDQDAVSGFVKIRSPAKYSGVHKSQHGGAVYLHAFLIVIKNREQYLRETVLGFLCRPYRSNV